MASFAFNNLLPDAFKGLLLDTDTYYVMLTASTYAADQDAHTKRSDVTNEVTGTGYTAGGQAIAPTFTKDTTNNRLQIVFPAVTWPSSTITARRAVYYKRRGGASSADELIAADDFGADVTTTAATFSLAATTININTPV
jgi:hypothetical protein